ncbi:MAG: choice-of-anchor Q domain-containing protein, partial [Candidatus Cloacimonadota bacterium]|nr:choice-of-anchor Q domain-containing protein [Candidatus Cloacimonadota bacterium]
NAITGADFNIYNSVLYGNYGHEFAIDTREASYTGSTVNISHSLIEGGEAGIPIYGVFPSTLNWLEGNLDCDPMVDEDYYPLDNSPLIDAGSVNIPMRIEIPEFDLAGNPRVMGGSIDIGCYEWNGWGVPADENVISFANDLYVYPNPLIASQMRDGKAKILWMGEASSDMQFEIFNVKGQKVRTLKIQNSKLKITASTAFIN